MTKRRLVSLIVIGGMAISASVAAQNWRFLRDAPITFFTPRDVELFRANLRDALDNAKDGERRSWSNSASGASGSVALEQTSHRGETVCRHVRLNNSAKGHGGFTRKTFCKRPGRDWTVQP